MRNVLVFFLFLCLILALYSHIFLGGDTVSFEETYKDALQLVADIGDIFGNMKDGVVTTMQTVMELPEKIGNFFSDFFNKIGGIFTNLGNRIGNFFTGIWNEILMFFGGEPISCGCDSGCTDCLEDLQNSYFYDDFDGHTHCGKTKYCSCSWCESLRTEE